MLSSYLETNKEVEHGEERRERLWADVGGKRKKWLSLSLLSPLPIE
jgi:hypothetical protein